MASKKVKRCSKCKKLLVLSNFRKDKTKKDGLYSSCNDCHRKMSGAQKFKHNLVGYIDNYKIVKYIHDRYLWVSEKKQRLHKYIMEKNLGRRLTSKECVHHINGNIFDNRIENLIILSSKEHKKKHPTPLSKDTIILYCSCGKSFNLTRCQLSKRKTKYYVCRDCSGHNGGRYPNSIRKEHPING